MASDDREGPGRGWNFVSESRAHIIQFPRSSNNFEPPCISFKPTECRLIRLESSRFKGRQSSTAIANPEMKAMAGNTFLSCISQEQNWGCRFWGRWPEHHSGVWPEPRTSSVESGPFFHLTPLRFAFTAGAGTGYTYRSGSSPQTTQLLFS